MSKPVLDATMTLENSGYIRAMDSATTSTKRALETIKTVGLGITGLTAAFYSLRSIEGVMEGVMKSFEAGRELAKMSRQTGETVGDLVMLRKAFTVAGVSGDMLGRSLFMMNKALGGVNEQGEPTAAAFGRIGLSIAKLKDMSALGQFRAIIDGLQKMPDQASKASVAMGIFGRSAMELQSVLNDPEGFEEALKQAAPLAAVMQRNAKAFEDVQRSIEKLQGKTKGLFAGIAEGLAPTLENVLHMLGKIDLVGVGRQIGQAIALISQAFKDGKVFEILRLGLSAAFKQAVNVGAAGIMGWAYGLAQTFANLPHLLRQAFATITNGTFWKGIAELAVGAFLSFHSRLTQMFISVGVLTKSLLQDAANAFLKTMSAAMKWNPATYLPGLAIGKLVDNKSLRDRELENASAAQGAFGLLGRAGKAGSTLEKQGLADIASGTKPYIADVLTAIKSSFETAIAKFSSTKMLQIPEIKALADTIEKLQANLPTSEEMEVSRRGGSGAGNTTPNINYKMPEADQRARLGFFIGGAPAMPGISEARRTADATERTQKLLEKIIASGIKMDQHSLDQMGSAFA